VWLLEIFFYVENPSKAINIRYFLQSFTTFVVTFMAKANVRPLRNIYFIKKLLETKKNSKLTLLTFNETAGVGISKSI
jgi:hypothetical protein